MENQDLRVRVREVVGQMSPLGPRPAQPGDRLVDDLGYDSLAVIELSLQLEADFGLKAMTGDATADIVTVADIEDLIERTAAPAGNAG